MPICPVRAYLVQSDRKMHKREIFGNELVPGYSKSIVCTFLDTELITNKCDQPRVPTRHLLDQKLLRYHSSVTSLGVLLMIVDNSGCIKTNSDPFCRIKSIIMMNRITTTAYPHICAPHRNRCKNLAILRVTVVTVSDGYWSICIQNSQFW